LLSALNPNTFDNDELWNGDLVGSSPDFQVSDDALSPANRGGEGKKSSISFLNRSGALRNGDTGGASNQSFDVDIIYRREGSPLLWGLFSDTYSSTS
jgi:hypothetical protein